MPGADGAGASVTLGIVVQACLDTVSSDHAITLVGVVGFAVFSHDLVAHTVDHPLVAGSLLGAPLSAEDRDPFLVQSGEMPMTGQEELASQLFALTGRHDLDLALVRDLASVTEAFLEARAEFEVSVEAEFFGELVGRQEQTLTGADDVAGIVVDGHEADRIRTGHFPIEVNQDAGNGPEVDQGCRVGALFVRADGRGVVGRVSRATGRAGVVFLPGRIAGVGQAEGPSHAQDFTAAAMKRVQSLNRETVFAHGGYLLLGVVDGGGMERSIS